VLCPVVKTIPLRSAGVYLNELYESACGCQDKTLLKRFRRYFSGGRIARASRLSERTKTARLASPAAYSTDLSRRNSRTNWGRVRAAVVGCPHEHYGKGPVCKTMLTVLPASTMWPAAGDWLNTQEPVPFCPVNFATSPAAWISCAARTAEIWRTLGTVLFAGLPTCSMCQFTM
jgi:hypothetical protein